MRRSPFSLLVLAKALQGCVIGVRCASRGCVMAAQRGRGRPRLAVGGTSDAAEPETRVVVPTVLAPAARHGWRSWIPLARVEPRQCALAWRQSRVRANAASPGAWNHAARSVRSRVDAGWRSLRTAATASRSAARHRVRSCRGWVGSLACLASTSGAVRQQCRRGRGGDGGGASRRNSSWSIPRVDSCWNTTAPSTPGSSRRWRCQD